MGEKGGVREVLETGRVVCHDVQVSWDVVGKVAIAVVLLMLAGVVANVGSGAITGHHAHVDAGDGRRVVGEVDYGGVAGVMRGGHEVDLGKEAGLLEVIVPLGLSKETRRRWISWEKGCLQT